MAVPLTSLVLSPRERTRKSRYPLGRKTLLGHGGVHLFSSTLCSSSRRAFRSPSLNLLRPSAQKSCKRTRKRRYPLVEGTPAGGMEGFTYFQVGFAPSPGGFPIAPFNPFGLRHKKAVKEHKRAPTRRVGKAPAEAVSGTTAQTSHGCMPPRHPPPESPDTL